MFKTVLVDENRKEQFIHEIFSIIAHRYDVMNTVLSFNQDTYWRKYAARKAEIQPGSQVVDICCGTGKLSIELAKAVGSKGKVIGVDFCQDMLAQAEKNIVHTPYNKIIKLQVGNAMALPFPDGSFDCATNAFALRNVPNMEKVLREMRRVVKPGGRVVTLELAKPSIPIFRELYYMYFEKVLPLIGRCGVGLDYPYRWLPTSLKHYPGQKEVCEIFRRVGLRDTDYHELTGGIVAVHIGKV